MMSKRKFIFAIFLLISFLLVPFEAMGIGGRRCSKNSDCPEGQRCSGGGNSESIGTCVCLAGTHWEGFGCVPDEPAEPEGQAINLPSLEHFTLEDSDVGDDYIYLVFAPNGTDLFNLYVRLTFSNGQDVLSTWCTGDESLCKAVGNGKACSGTDYTGANAWCYLAE